MAQLTRPCDGCGKGVPRTKPTGSIPRFCSDDCKPRCSVPTCGKATFSRGWCGAHAARARITGDPETPFKRGKNDGPCGVEGCRQPMRKRGWCASHYAQWMRSGEEPKPFGYKWADMALCKVCGNPPAPTFREFCSGACAYLWRKYDGKVPSHRPCISCGVKIDLTVRGKGGQRVKATIKLCRRCRQDKRKHGMSVLELAERDGTDCGICGDPVDMTLTHQSENARMRPSVDHILPRARGGTNDPSNLQLAHLWCNQIKSDRVDDVA